MPHVTVGKENGQNIDVFYKTEAADSRSFSVTAGLSRPMIGTRGCAFELRERMQMRLCANSNN